MNKYFASFSLFHLTISSRYWCYYYCAVVVMMVMSVRCACFALLDNAIT